MDRELTPKQKAFCDYYIETGNASESYKRAYPTCIKDGTARTNASKLLTRANVSKYINERMKKIEDKRIAKADEVLQYLTKVMRGEEKDQFGLDASLQDRNKAAEMLGKRYRLFTDKVEVEATVPIQIVDDIDDED